MNFVYKNKCSVLLIVEINKKYLALNKGISDRKDLPSLLNN